MPDPISRVALVTGADGAIGAATAARLIARGHTVVLLDRTSTVADRARALGGVPFTLDLGDIDAVDAAADELLYRFGRIDVLVNNAAIHPMKPGGELYGVEEIDDQSWALTMTVNVHAPFTLIRAVLPGMREAGWGRIVNIASRAGRAFSSGSSASYSASKAALVGLTRTVAGEYARYGITANVVAPGRTATPLLLSQSDAVQEEGLREIPRRRIGDPDDIAAAVDFLASDQAGNLVGAVLDVNGGTHMP
jgi:3-oxoacyl-[acyl-carrier protein] reductase